MKNRDTRDTQVERCASSHTATQGSVPGWVGCPTCTVLLIQFYFNGTIAQHKKMLVNRDENHYDLLVPENILSPRHCRELRILICFNSENRNVMDRYPVFFNDNNVRNC
eukprot:TRINITY_DN29997_c0_g4_i1.p1 TRINITY_DN29997_c0_g4~~TRINITY_DN29997_c0_g4_i1.p1  ORF type:complete len:109 (-),score=8.34 TRINITY_DN29997_c0_g4_i1:154-480(-)